MIRLNSVHHVALICSDYAKSLRFYTEVLGLRVLAEHYREQRRSYKTDLAIDDHYVLELFSFPDPPRRLTRPEAAGLRHLAFEVSNLDASVTGLEQAGVSHEAVRVDEYTGKRFVFFQDPDGLPIELYEQ